MKNLKLVETFKIRNEKDLTNFHKEFLHDGFKNLSETLKVLIKFKRIGIRERDQVFNS
mgnify:CR=1 FL=1